MDTIDTKPKVSPREFFMHVLTFSLLYAFAISFIGLWWEYINYKFPDALNPYFSFDEIRFPMAVLIIVFPLYIVLARKMTQEIVADAEKKEIWVYRWLVYLTLFVSAVTVIIDLVSLLYSYLGGELTARFGLKMLVALIVSGGIFGYYLWHLRSDVSQTTRGRRALLWGSVIVVLASIILGFIFVGSPATARARRFDDRRIQHLQSLQWEIVNYWQQKGSLPTSFRDIEDDLRGFRIPVDPLCENINDSQSCAYHYSYRAIDQLTFELCAKFQTEGSWPQGYYGRGVSIPDTHIKGGSSWDHGVGNVCFERMIDPDLFPKPNR